MEIIFKIQFDHSVSSQVLLGLVILPVIYFAGIVGTIIPACPCAVVTGVGIQALIIVGPDIIFIFVSDPITTVQGNKSVYFIVGVKALDDVISLAITIAVIFCIKRIERICANIDIRYIIFSGGDYARNPVFHVKKNRQISGSLKED